MSTKMKGFFKGLKYLTQMFDEKEEEFQIGYPTDVKHVAHIGCDGPSATTPSWMSEFKSPPEILNSKPVSAVTSLDVEKPLPEPQPEGSSHKRRSKRGSANNNSLTLDSPARKSGAPRPSRRQPSVGFESPLSSEISKEAPKHSRRHRSSNNSMDGDSSGSGKASRRNRSSSQGAVESSSADDQPRIPKHSRGRRSKGRSKELSQPLDNSFTSDDGQLSIIRDCV